MQKVVSMMFSLIALSLVVSVGIAEAADVGKATYVSGDVYVIRGAERLALTEGDGVLAADTVITGTRGRVALQMHDNSKVHIGRLSRVSLSNYALKEKSLMSGTFNVLWGRVRFFVAKLSDGSSFKVDTRTAVLGVRGTEFVVIVPMPKGLVDPLSLELPENLPELITTVYGIEGLVEGFSPTGERVLIGPGMKVEFTNDGKIKFTSQKKPISIPTVKPSNAPPPTTPDVPRPEDIIIPPPPQIRDIYPGQLTNGLG